MEKVLRLQDEMKTLSDARSTRQDDTGVTAEDARQPHSTEEPCTGTPHNTQTSSSSQSTIPRNKSTSGKPKNTPSTFEGTTPWIDFKTHFKCCAVLNEWDDKQKGLFLAVSLRGAAQQVLSFVKAEGNAEYEELMGALEKRFAPPNIEELYKSELRGRRHRQGESLLELGQSIRRLVSLAYPAAPLKVLNTLSKDSFLNALTYPEVRLKILRARPSTFDETMQVAVELKARMKAEENREGKNQRIVREVDVARAESDKCESEVSKLRKDVQQLKDIITQHAELRDGYVRRGSPRRRSRCGVLQLSRERAY